MKQREQGLIFEPQAICDGQNVWFYTYKPQKNPPDQPYVPEQESVSIQQVYGAPDDLNMPWPDLMPELLGHPDADGPAQFWVQSIDLKPSDGPAGTLRLQTREAQFQDPKLPDRYRLWVNPEKNFLALRSEISVYEATSSPMNTRIPTKTAYGVRRVAPAMRGSPTQLAYVETRILTDLARSPSGFWYPTRVLRETSNSKADQAIRFLLDFEGPIPDELFQPVR